MAEQDLIAFELSVWTLLYIMIAVTVISLCLIPYPLMALITMLSVGQILFGVMGYVSLWGQSLNGTLLMCLMLAAGFSIDYVAHFCHSFITAPLNTNGVTIFLRDQVTMDYSPANERKARVHYALNAVGIPMMKGYMMTMIGLLPLAMAKSEIIIDTFKVLILVMIFGIYHIMIYLPVLLSLIGPSGYRESNDLGNAPSNIQRIGSHSVTTPKPHHPVQSATTTVSIGHIDEMMKTVNANDGEVTKMHTERARSLEIIEKVCSSDVVTLCVHFYVGTC